MSRAAILILIVVATILFSIDYDKDIPNPAFLSRDLYFKIGQDIISVPVVAMESITVPPDNANPLPRYRFNPRFSGKGRESANDEFKTTLLSFATDVDAPAEVNSISLSINPYGTYSERAVSIGICSRLKKTWSQQVCRNEFPQEMKIIPRWLRLSNEEDLRPYRQSSFSDMSDLNGNNLFELLSPLSAQAKTTCNDDRVFCSSAIAVSINMYATWSSGCRQLTAEECEHANIVKGSAISEFVQNQLMAN